MSAQEGRREPAFLKLLRQEAEALIDSETDDKNDN
jgi:hypothetical protein